MSIKRKDAKGRILHDGEYQKKDGRYEYRYQDVNGAAVSVYSWRLTNSDPLPIGKRDSVPLRDAEKEIQHDLHDGIRANKKVTLNEQWGIYIQNKVGWRNSTRINALYQYDLYVRDTIGNLSLDQIKYNTLKQFYHRLRYRRNLKPGTITLIHAIISPVFTNAMRDGVIRMNPAIGVLNDFKKSDEWVTEKRHALTEHEQHIFLDYVSNHPQYRYWYPIFVCLLGTGCRIGELIGLRWQDVQWKENLISIDHAVQYKMTDSGKRQFYVGPTKSASGVRVVPMLSEVRKVLIAMYKEQEKTGFCDMVIDGYSGFIWKNRNGNLTHPHSVNDTLNRIIKSHNQEEIQKATDEHRSPDLLPHFSVHQLRHTFCTRLCENETDLKLIQEIMGHSDISITMNVYNESNTQRKREHFAKLDELSVIL